MRQITKLLVLAGAFTTAVPNFLYAQYEDLAPEEWYPLEIGNYWHYRSRDFFDEFIIHSDKDTLVAGYKWTRFKEVYCNGPDCFGPDRFSWHRFTSDFYLLGTRDFAEVDTLWKTTPRSIFTVNIPYDSTLQSEYAIPGSTNRPGFADVYINVIPTDADSTVLELRALLGFTGEVYCAAFIYRIGFVSNCSAPGIELVGAIVNRVEYRDVSRIRALVSTEDDLSELPERFWLGQNYPNPFNPSTTIAFDLPEQEHVTLEVYNALGELVTTLAAGQMSAGHHLVTWNAAGLSSGVYLYRLTAGGFSEAKRMLLLK